MLLRSPYGSLGLSMWDRDQLTFDRYVLALSGFATSRAAVSSAACQLDTLPGFALVKTRIGFPPEYSPETNCANNLP